MCVFKVKTNGAAETFHRESVVYSCVLKAFLKLRIVGFVHNVVKFLGKKFTAAVDEIGYLVSCQRRVNVLALDYEGSVFRKLYSSKFLDTAAAQKASQVFQFSAGVAEKVGVHVIIYVFHSRAVLGRIRSPEQFQCSGNQFCF